LLHLRAVFFVVLLVAVLAILFNWLGYRFAIFESADCANSVYHPRIDFRLYSGGPNFL
jgi:hypothetical protein